MLSSTPNLLEFNPKDVPYQFDVIKDIRKNFEYKFINSDGEPDIRRHEVLLSGSVGSAKSILMAHLAVTHCLLYPYARVCLGRKALPDLKGTIYQKILEHMDGALVEGDDYSKNDQTATIRFKNGSEIISRSWADRRFKKFRSLELSMLIIEELTENDNDYWQFYAEASSRVNRLPHVPEQIIVCATNPDSPSHKAYEYFMLSKDPTRHVYYSVTTDNKFLPKSYINQLLEMYDEKMAKRMVYGRWIEIASESIYYAFNDDLHFKKETEWKVIPNVPIHMCWDFNIGLGKPMSVCFFQHVDNVFHFFNELVIHGFRTLDILEEALQRGILDHQCIYVINGDASGKNNDTRSIATDYDIIANFLSKAMTKSRQRIRYRLAIPRSNPPLKKRHNLVNGQLKSASGQVRVQLYKGCDKLAAGLRLTTLKKGSQYLEDDSFEAQHITTAAGYGIVTTINENNMAVATVTDY